MAVKAPHQVWTGLGRDASIPKIRRRPAATVYFSWYCCDGPSLQQIDLLLDSAPLNIHRSTKIRHNLQNLRMQLLQDSQRDFSLFKLEPVRLVPSKSQLLRIDLTANQALSRAFYILQQHGLVLISRYI